MKLHIGCGTVYLKGWVNVDLPGPDCHLAQDRPDLVERYATTEEEGYYARHAKTLEDLRKGPLAQDYVCDRYGSYHFLPAKPESASEILARHSFEHLSITEARRALVHLNQALEPNGILRLDVPNHDETLKLFGETKDPFYIRHLLGPRRGDFGFHCMSYTPERLERLASDYGFRFAGTEPNIHLYPAFCLRLQKVFSWFL